MPRVPRLQVVRGTTNGVEAWAARFAQVVVEVVAGDRSVSQLLRCTTPEVYADLSRRTAVLHRSVAPHQRLRRQRAVVRSVHVFCPVVTAAEVSVHVRHGDRGNRRFDPLRARHRADRVQARKPGPRLYGLRSLGPGCVRLLELDGHGRRSRGPVAVAGGTPQAGLLQDRATWCDHRACRRISRAAAPRKPPSGGFFLATSGH